MLSAKRKSDGQTVAAYFESKRNGPFLCQDCHEEMILKNGRNKINHFAHVNPIACQFATGESDEHRRCKLEIYEALLKEPQVRSARLELPLGFVRPDIFAEINGTPVAIEVQMSSLGLETIQQRTIEYGGLGIYVLWLLQWKTALDGVRYRPKLWEKWIHALYFGQIYYWLEGLKILSYHFEPHFTPVPSESWISPAGKKMKAGGFIRQSRSMRTPVCDGFLNLAHDFIPEQRYWWEGGGFKLPDAKLFVWKKR